MNLPQPNLEQIKNFLLHRQKQVEEDIKEVEKEDPILNNQGLAEASEPGTDSWMADIHARAMSTKQNLKDLLGNIKKALNNINSGKFGKCEKCGKDIEASRLKVIPTATLCIACSKRSKR